MGNPARTRSPYARARSLSSVFQFVLRENRIPLNLNYIGRPPANATMETGVPVHNIGLPSEEHLALRAVVFDYGMVLTGLPNQEAHNAMVRLTGLTGDRFEELYWRDRHAYDEGKLNGVTFWQKFAKDSGLSLTPDQLDELNRLDARMWTTQNPAMIAWHQRLKAAGLRTAILSNMGDSVLASIEREFTWLRDFDVLVWSFQLGIAKPDPAIYQYVLEKLGTRPEETLFLDDKRVNIDAARALGIGAIEFTTIQKLREDLLAAGLEGVLPIPSEA
jgi:putative hydrolase of the HAD superfamily